MAAPSTVTAWCSTPRRVRRNRLYRPPLDAREWTVTLQPSSRTRQTLSQVCVHSISCDHAARCNHAARHGGSPFILPFESHSHHCHFDSCAGLHLQGVWPRHGRSYRCQAQGHFWWRCNGTSPSDSHRSVQHHGRKRIVVCFIGRISCPTAGRQGATSPRGPQPHGCPVE